MSENEENQDFEDVMEYIGINMKDKGDVVELNDDIEADIVFDTKKRTWVKYLLLIPLSALVFVVFIVTIFLSQVKIVPVPTIGANYTIGEYSVIPDSYVPSIKDIQVGTKIVIGSRSDSFIGPLAVDYEVVEVKKINNNIILVSQKGSKDLRDISIFDVLYIVSD